MRTPDGWVLVPREPTEDMIDAGLRATAVHLDIQGSGLTVNREKMRRRYAGMLAAVPPPPKDPEIATGVTMTGIAGAMYRLIDCCDYRFIMGWVRSEIIRNTDEHLIMEAAAAMVASTVLQVAGLRTRSVVRETARAIMTKASHLLEKDLQEMLKAKKADSVLKNNIRLVPPA